MDLLFEQSISRLRQKCNLRTLYSHDNLAEWLKNSLNTRDNDIPWEIISPKYCVDSVTSALSTWPQEEIKPRLIDWLQNEKQYIGDVNDFLDGLCEPLALYFSKSILSFLKNGKETQLNLDEMMESALKKLMDYSISDAAGIVLNDFVSNSNDPHMWGPNIDGNYTDYLFGKGETRYNVKSNAENPMVDIMPIYMINYIFDCDELDEEDINMINPEETAQYSLHVVGLVFDKPNRRVYVADANGPVIPGGNYEFVEIPCKKRKAKESTCVSRHDLDLRLLAAGNALKRKRALEP